MNKIIKSFVILYFYSNNPS